jgi:hypothetical protein
MRFSKDNKDEDMTSNDVFIATKVNSTIKGFDKGDALVLDAPLYDGNGDGIVKFGKNGVLDLNGPDDGGDMLAFADAGIGKIGLVMVGTTEVNGVTKYIYARADSSEAEKADALAQVNDEGTVGGDETFVVTDNEAGIKSFDNAESLLVDAPLPDGNGDGVITLGGNGILDLDGADAGEDTINFEDPEIEELGLIYSGTVERHGETKYIYNRADASASDIDIALESVDDDDPDAVVIDADGLIV